VDKIAHDKSNRYLGVDIGEYGLAWHLIEVDGDKIVSLDYGFMADPQQQTLKKAVQDLRAKQVRATFNSPDTQVARIRESLIGSYRNQLEDLAMRKNATLCFEYEVSGFESGGAKIAKVYDSVKRGDVNKKENDSAKQQAWGKRGDNNWAYETTAAGTSQFCTKCKRWSSLAINENETYEIAEYQDGLHKAKINDGEVRLFSKEPTLSLNGRELKSAIYKAMRPNIDGEGMAIVKRQKAAQWKAIEQQFGAGKPRGNIGIYICPYTDCHHISDADIQAAFNIAVRGYLKEKHPERAEKTGELGLSAEFLCGQQNKITHSAIDLDVKNGI
jgi:hypothetical protein